MNPLGLLWLGVCLGLTSGCPADCDCHRKFSFQIADCAYRDLEAVPSGFLPNVTTLSLSANKLTGLGVAAFVEVPLLQSLWLAYNEISSVEPGALAVLSQVKSIDVSHNRLADFPWGDLHNLTALQLLKMDNNHLVALPQDAFLSLQALRSLQLNHNQFLTIAEGTFDALTSLSHLQINNNPFNCSCRLLWLKAWAEDTHVSIPERNSITCASPPSLQGVPLARLPPQRCTPPTARVSHHPSLDSAEVQEGWALALHCAASGHPQPQLQWRIQTPGGTVELRSPNVQRDGQALAGGPKHPRFLAFGNGSLVVPQFSRLEEGTYTCHAKNELGHAEGSVNVTLATAESPLEDLLVRKFQAKRGGGKGCSTMDNEVVPSGAEDNIVIIYLSGRGPQKGKAGGSLELGLWLPLLCLALLTI
ncbi:immunoglobulin superfamily containing leucine-rich repeat protein [Ornithorhynchus anatinus]|uniref:immunoglobulin superfamily containing leucine-rich repeat protein n=1 Tax=Ornithorhynchus anatinus TaxID=9258 RepID=UPI0010A82A96|nr:immunoglobulin superfamily containing leucine-rich repeat protein [Ornithorhynchus anatinus]XP_007663289.2 immunoglobulin superfamily containing leucine-rich repeat protein [Ornithorhynchus anatinus]